MTTNITLYKSDILPHNPCADGLDWFDTLVKLQGRKRSLLIRGTTSLLWLYSNPESKSFAGWARQRGLLPPLYAQEADLSRADLSRADLSKADLSEANLSEANLSRADLSRAYLSWADLSGADLSRADLRGADLRWADLRWADLRGANLSWADLSGALREKTDTPVPGWKLVGGRLQKAVG